MNRAGVEKLSDEYGIKIGENNIETAKAADILFLAVKPNIYPNVISEIKDYVKESCVVVSIAAGQSLETVGKLFGGNVKIVRVMPNMPALVGEGMAAVCGNEFAHETDVRNIADIFNCLGRAEIVSEKLMDIVTAVSGSSPAYVYIFIEALADAAVLGGMRRDMAYEFAAQSVLGSAKMVIETGKHPGELKDMVCSPAGTTIEAVAELEKFGLRSTVISAVRACMEKSREMGRKHYTH